MAMNRAYKTACTADCERATGCSGVRECAVCGRPEYSCEMTPYKGGRICDDCRRELEEDDE